MGKYREGWVGRVGFGMEDFRHSLRVLKEVLEDSLSLQHF